MASKPQENSGSGSAPPQRKTTLKWGSDGELSAIDMARILGRLQNTDLTECDISVDMKE